MAIILGLLVLLSGAAMAAGGVWLVTLGGSAYYVIAGVALVVSALLVFARHPLARWIFAAVLVATLVWAVIEVGFDWWQLAPRGGVLVVLGILLLLPFVARRFRVAGRSRGVAPLLLALVLCGGVAAASFLIGDPHDTEGELPLAAPAVAAETTTVDDGDWAAYGRTTRGTRYSPLAAITPENVANLEVAWTFRTGDLNEPDSSAAFQATPLEVDGTLYLCTQHQWVIALDAAAGTELWRFDPEVTEPSITQHKVCRGVSYFAAPEAAPGDACAERIFLSTGDARLIAVDAATGALCAGFADAGQIDLWQNVPNFRAGIYFNTSPPLVAGGLVIVGGSVSDNVTVDNPSGTIRAYDAVTGTLVWNFDPGNPDATEPIAPGEFYTPNGPNAWSILSADEELGLVYVPMGNVPPDQYGVNRSETTERFSAATIALSLETGALVWVFQAVHHDLWDMDMPSQPVLIDLDIDGELRPALIQPTKQGDIYVLDRRTGVPIFPVTEVPAPGGAIPPDFTAPTQPVSAITFMPDPLRESDMWGATMFDQLLCRIKFRQLNYEGRYTPPSLEGTLQHPGNFGIFNWGSVAVDPVRQVMFATPAYIPFTIQLVPRPDDTTNVVGGGEAGTNENYGAPYAVDIQNFVSQIGIPCNAPPWGYVAGIDLRTGETVWQHRNGTAQDQAPFSIPLPLGVPSLGGPIITAGGVAFLSGTLDYFLRAYDLTTGEEIWKARLPAGAHATPVSYEAGGRQYVVVAAGGHGGLGTEQGDYVIAYTLPDGAAE
ncbi:MAG: membrane-bound PQQ-dependent dehydrogenase, glucose/quinate/shikimate family [Bauldia sp.]|nr:membrane-bound PQQ-dependent dehydrogenase, glucose/quinate/shikimate family [Bauldia sp.]